MQAIYKFHFDAGRAGTLYGLFVADDQELLKLIQSGYHVRFGEALGKHSDISGPIEDRDITKISDQAIDIEVVQRLKLEVGHNPLRRYNQNIERDEEELRS